MKKRYVGYLAGIIMTAAAASGCAVREKNAASDPGYEPFMVVDVFDSQANYQGIQSGWFARIVKEKFNMELNIIAPNVAGGGDMLFQTRSAAGNLGDLIITGANNGRLQNLVSAGLVMDMTELIQDAGNLNRYRTAIEKTGELVEREGIYAIPSEVSSNDPSMPSEGSEPNYGVYLRWDVYRELGYPEIDTLEDLLPVLQKMQEAQPLSDSGKKTWAISLFRDWDANLMSNAKPEACLYGFDELGFVLAKADGSEYQSLIDSDSAYIRSLRFLFQANQLGLVDPESANQNYETVFAKYQDGQILFSPYSWLGQGAYNTQEHTEKGKGFMLAEIKDQTIFSYGCQIYGNPNNCLMIGSKAKDPQRLADFIDWLYSPEGVMCAAQQSAYTCGPEGLTWEMKDDEPVLTDFGRKALSGETVTVPEEWGNGTWMEGVSALNYRAVNQLDTDPGTGMCYDYAAWSSVREQEGDALHQDWQEHNGAECAMEFLQDKNQILVAPGSGYASPRESSQITTLRGQCKSLIVDYSWKMIFAEDEAEFDALLEELQHTLAGMGYDAVLEYDMECAKAQNNARLRMTEEYVQSK